MVKKGHTKRQLPHLRFKAGDTVNIKINNTVMRSAVARLALGKKIKNLVL